MRRTSLAFAAGACLGLTAAGCQIYDFEPVRPVTLAQTTFQTVAYTRTLKPNLFILVDRSGSMTTQIDPLCTGGGCKTRISELRSSMDTFLTTSATLARMGLAFFPNRDVAQCAPTAAETVPLPAPTADDSDAGTALEDTAAAIKAEIDGVPTGGGTPTAASLAFLGTLPGLTNVADNRDDFILLLTDGLPNCNDANANNVCACGSGSSFCASEAACSCTLGAQANGTSGCRVTCPAGATSCNCRLGCLDQDSATARVAELNKKGIRTIVVGFGADTGAGDAQAVLNAMAVAGGFARTCPSGTDAECGTNNTCDPATLLCAKKFYQATNSAELSAALTNIAGGIVTGNPCQFKLSAQPESASYLAVLIDGASVPPGDTTWSYSGGSVTFAPTSVVCQRILQASNVDGVNVEIRIVQRL